MSSTAEHTSVLASILLCGYCNSMGIATLVIVPLRRPDLKVKGN
jgi:hypothetical protein